MPSEFITHERDEAFGELAILSRDDGVDFLLETVGATRPDEQRPGRAVFTAFLTSARAVVFENDYFDIDWRSELAILVRSAFEPSPPSVDRLHFFRQEPQADERIRDFVTRAADGYLGYTIIRPQQEGRFGRSIIPTDIPLRDDIPAGVTSSQVRTAVAERVHVFGVALTATGVPFMEQDGSLMRCAHISAWVCHYTAVLRGSVARRPTAHFYTAAESAGTIGRPFPSTGVTTMALSAMLRASDLPPEVLDAHQLRQARRFTWADRPELVAAATKAAEVDLTSSGSEHYEGEAEQLLWIRENLSAVVCRYLNSGIPVILARDSLEHTQVVIGYLRSRDLSSPASTAGGTAEHDDAHSDVVAFIVNDDQEGPFVVVPLDELVQEIANEEFAATQIVAPLPNSLWMSGEAAEQIATIAMPVLAEGRAAQLNSWFDRYGRSGTATLAQHRARLDYLLQGLDEAPFDRFTVRTYATTGVDFQQSFAARVADPEAARAAGSAKLSKYVWVIEVLDRQLRREGRPAVVSTIVLDASRAVSAFESPMSADLLAPPFAHVPGQVFARSTFLSQEDAIDYLGDIEGGSVEKNWWWPTSLEPYQTGRWGQEQVAGFPDRLLGQAKSAIPS